MELSAPSYAFNKIPAAWMRTDSNLHNKSQKKIMPSIWKILLIKLKKIK
jgi:hypothetical protein